MANISDIPASPSTIVTTRSKCQKTLHDTVYTEQWTSSRETAISERCVLHAIPVTSWPARKVMHRINEAAVLLSNALVEHWHFCNVYTIGERQIVKKICGVYNEFKNKCQTRMDRKTDKWKERMSTYNHQLKSRLFDISTLDRQPARNLVDDIPRAWLPWGPERVTDQLLYLFLDRKWEKTHTKETERPSILQKNEEKWRVFSPWSYTMERGSIRSAAR